jgi:uncharacterized repeat protein (TIGR01451 family)
MRHGSRVLGCTLVLVTVSSTPAVARADDFAEGSLIVPMDVEYQDEGMLRAYGLVYELLRNDVPVRWTIRDGKDFGDVDFSASVEDFATGADLGQHGYRGGPWVIDAADAEDAAPVVESWLATYPEVNVHEATQAFTADVARYLVVAPTIAMVADGNQDIARGYMQAAAIPDSSLDYEWPNTSPDMLDVPELAGPTDANHADGALFDDQGNPVYCQLMSMHWGIRDAEDNPEVVAEVRQFLNHPTHFFAECQAVNAFENLEPHGFFLTPNGFEIADRPDAVDFYHADSPFGQLDGGWETVGGSEPAYSLPAGDVYKAGDITMVTEQGTPEGVGDVWMTGFLDGACPPDLHECGQYGKVSYLGGHRYSVDHPISANPDTQGTRMFLNSLFEAPCATASGLPALAVVVGAPAQTTDPEVTLRITYVNTGFTTALDATLMDTLPPGVTFVSASGGGAHANGVVTWELGNLGPGASGDLEIDVVLPAYGIYDNAAELQYRVGLNDLQMPSNVSSTEYADEFPDSTGSATESGESATSGGDSGTGSASNGMDSDGATTSGATDGGSAGGGVGSQGTDGCGCTSGRGRGGSVWLLLGALVFWRRRCGVAAAALGLAACGGESPQPDASGTGLESISESGTGVETTSSVTGFKLDAGSPDTPFEPTTGCNKIDFLFLIDSSESMKDHQTNLIDSFDGFAAAIRSAVQADDWHVLVTDTDAQWGGVHCANACSTIGSCPDEPSFPCDTPPPELCDITIGAGEIAPYGEGASNRDCGVGPGRRYLSNEDVDLESVFACVAQVGVDGNSHERQADALVRALSTDLNEPGACNAGFLREDAILVLTLITDEPDEYSEGDALAWYEAIVAAKGGDEAAIVVLGLLPDGDADDLCGTARTAPRLVELVESMVNSSRASVCESDYSPFFVDAVDVIATTCEDFVPPG